METKLFEIRDKATFIPAMAILVSGDDGYLMRRAGFGSPMVFLVMLVTKRCSYDSADWGDRTLSTAHRHMEECWDLLRDGDVIDVRFILGESQKPCRSERDEMMKELSEQER